MARHIGLDPRVHNTAPRSMPLSTITMPAALRRQRRSHAALHQLHHNQCSPSSTRDNVGHAPAAAPVLQARTRPCAAQSTAKRTRRRVVNCSAVQKRSESAGRCEGCSAGRNGACFIAALPPTRGSRGIVQSGPHAQARQ
jgi:hypothetical protein